MVKSGAESIELKSAGLESVEPKPIEAELSDVASSEALSSWGMPRAQSVKLEPLSDPFKATLALPGSKSCTNRALILSALATGVSELKSPLFSDDSYWCVDALKRLGVHVEAHRERDEIKIIGVGEGALTQQKIDEPLYLGSAGTAARFLPAVIAARGAGVVTLTASSQLSRRPIAELVRALRALGAQIEMPSSEVSDHETSDNKDSEGASFPMRVWGGSLRGGQVEISGQRSSQFISALLLAAPLAPEPVSIHIIDSIVQADYVRITLEMMARWGVEVEHDDALTSFHITPQRYQARDELIEADASTATCLFALAAATQSELTITNLNLNTRQPDILFLDHLEAMGCEVTRSGQRVTLRGPERLNGGLCFDFKPCSDSTPALAVAAAFASSSVEVSGVAHIRRHECDRLSVICEHLRRAGVAVEEREDGFKIDPTPHAISAFHAEPHDDHRMAMAFSALALAGRGAVVEDPACVSKTCPTFYDMIKTLGGRFTLTSLCIVLMFAFTSLEGYAQRAELTPTQDARGVWALCLLIEGPAAVYPAQVYAVQSRYGSWMSEWRRHRPHDHPTDEEVGLITADQLGRALGELSRVAGEIGAEPVITDESPPCDSTAVSARPQLHAGPSELVAWIWALNITPQAGSRTSTSSASSPTWRRWRLEDPHVGGLSQNQGSMARVITRLLRETITPRADRDRLTPAHLRGSLKLSVSRPARVYINGVDRGAWPDPRPLEVPAGDYHIHAVPLDRGSSTPAHPVTYTKVQVVSGRLTRFTIDLE